jgi:hypothetical protein
MWSSKEEIGIPQPSVSVCGLKMRSISTAKGKSIFSRALSRLGLLQIVDENSLIASTINDTDQVIS